MDVVTDGKQRRDSYASFVASRLDNCQLIPLTDLLPLVDDPEAFERELRALDVPAGEVRHPAVFGRLGRSRPIAVHEARFAMSLTAKQVKVALPGPYLLARTMWMECISDRAYQSREDIANDIVRVLREELADLLAADVAMVQFDEPVLSEIVFTGPRQARSFICGVLSASADSASERAFARNLVNAVTTGFPRIALHLCRGHWILDESTCLSGDYTALAPTVSQMRVGTCLLELRTPRAGEVTALRSLPEDRRIGVGVGVVNQKHAGIATTDEIMAKAEATIAMFGAERVLLHPNYGFATCADNPVSPAGIAQQKLRTIAAASARLRERHRV